jgi:hypothetical protein
VFIFTTQTHTSFGQLSMMMPVAHPALSLPLVSYRSTLALKQQAAPSMMFTSPI